VLSATQGHATIGTLARLRRQLKRRGITLERVAAHAGCGLPHVSHVFAGRHVSQPVLAIARALLREARAANGKRTVGGAT